MNKSCLRNCWYMLERCGRLLGHDEKGASIFVLDGKVWARRDEQHISLLGDYFLHMALVRQGVRKLIRVPVGDSR
jgi:hypothetical protein